MKVRLLVVEAKQHDLLKQTGRSNREFQEWKSCNIPSDSNVTGSVITIRGSSYFVLEQLPARKAVNQGKKFKGPRMRK